LKNSLKKILQRKDPDWMNTRGGMLALIDA